MERIGLVSLLVAGIGVANTMMMSINERTREVGILKVLGTEFSDIAKLFLTEAFLLGLAGEESPGSDPEPVDGADHSEDSSE
ncbi:MAG: FtsX-like permease family protein [Anaerosacchariphilus sp.]